MVRLFVRYLRMVLVTVFTIFRIGVIADFRPTFAFEQKRCIIGKFVVARDAVVLRGHAAVNLFLGIALARQLARFSRIFEILLDDGFAGFQRFCLRFLVFFLESDLSVAVRQDVALLV